VVHFSVLLGGHESVMENTSSSNSNDGEHITYSGDESSNHIDERDPLIINPHVNLLDPTSINPGLQAYVKIYNPIVR
jgi:hypothetical protein